MADRLRVEAEQGMVMLQENHSNLEGRLAQALDAQREKESELKKLRAEQKHISRKLAAQTLQQQEEQVELNALRNLVKELANFSQQEEGQILKECVGIKPAPNEHPNENETDAKEYSEEQVATCAWDPEDVDNCPEMGNELDYLPLTGKGVAEEYLRCLAAKEKKKERQKDPRKIVMLSERSW